MNRHRRRFLEAGGGSLRARIAAGYADPISDRERQQLQELRAIGIRRFGIDFEAEDGPSSTTRPFAVATSGPSVYGWLRKLLGSSSRV